MSLLPLLRTTGGLPLAQLNMRAPGTASEILDELRNLVADGLVSVQGDRLPETEEDLKSGTAVVKLTNAGTRRAFR